LLGDHAGRIVPGALGDLGLSAEAMDRHITWDIGVEGLGLGLAQALGACFVRQRFSRLVIDCNRAPERPDAIAAVSDGAVIPGNAALTPAQRLARRVEVFEPYHARIAQELDARAAAGQPSVVVALHSFTPVMDGFVRPWRFGVLHAEDSPFSTAVLARLRAEAGPDVVGDNRPYRMDETDYTVPHHARPRGLDYLELEVRQDTIAGDDGQRQVADLLARLLPAALGDLKAE
jgi:predicted N-formylglutamate amidohydrolase